MNQPAKKSLGQHWLNDAASLLAVVNAAKVSTHDTIVEIGPGHGSLTAALTANAEKVIAVEKDENLAAGLTSKVNMQNLEVIAADILEVNFANFPHGYKIVANIPYYLTSNLIRILSETANPPKLAALLIQKEVAERVAAAPGQMSILAVTAQFFWQVNLGQIITADKFDPMPKVNSQILVLTRRTEPPFKVNEKQFFRLVKAGFAAKRKTLENNLAANFHIDKKRAAELLTQAEISPKARAQTLSLTEWYKLYQRVNSLKLT